MITLVPILLHLLIFSYYGFRWAGIAGGDKRRKTLFGATGFVITMVTALLINLGLYAIRNYILYIRYDSLNAFFQRYYLQLFASSAVVSLVLLSELFALLLKRRFSKLNTEIENIGRYYE